jgi:hypothetical protein
MRLGRRGIDSRSEASSLYDLIVFVMGDPVKAGLVESFNRPGGKRLSLLHELTLGVPVIGALLNPNSPGRGGRADNRVASSCGESQR